MEVKVKEIKSIDRLLSGKTIPECISENREWLIGESGLNGWSYTMDYAGNLLLKTWTQVINNNESWKDVKNFEGLYQVSSLGKVQRIHLLDEGKQPKLIQLSTNKNGYVTFRFYNRGIGKTLYVHRIVAEAFLENPNNLDTVNHKNGIKDDNRVENLEWSSYSDNHKHAYRVLGRKLSGSVVKK